jgi:putative transcriptional regulator
LKKGQILVSNYTLVNDIEFNKTLILIVESNIEGIVGFVFNKESEYQLSDIDEKLRGSR